MIAANCVVTKDVTAYSVVAGNPGKVIAAEVNFYVVHIMEPKRKWYKYFFDNLYKFIVWFVFLFVTAILILLSTKIISRIPYERNQGASVEEVKIYFPENEPDTLLNIIQGQLNDIQETIELMRNDSISVSVKKLSK